MQVALAPLVSSAVSPLSEEAMSSQQPCGWGRLCAIPVQTPAAVKTRLPVPPSTHCTHPVSPGSDFEESDKINLLTLEAGTSFYLFNDLLCFITYESYVFGVGHMCVWMCAPLYACRG